MKPRQPYKGLKPKAIEALSFHHLAVSALAILERAPSLPQARCLPYQEKEELIFVRRLIDELAKACPENVEGLLLAHRWRFSAHCIEDDFS
jgi:hypothetical protein